VVRVRGVSAEDGEPAEFEWCAQPGRVYCVEQIEGLRGGEWSARALVTAVADTVRFLDPDASAVTQRFYRIRQLR
jgi:hypothetical protein